MCLKIFLSILKLKSVDYNASPRSSQCSCANINNVHKSTPTCCAAFCSLFVRDAGSGSSTALKIPGLETSILKNSVPYTESTRIVTDISSINKKLNIEQLTVQTQYDQMFIFSSASKNRLPRSHTNFIAHWLAG